MTVALPTGRTASAPDTAQPAAGSALPATAGDDAALCFMDALLGLATLDGAAPAAEPPSQEPAPADKAEVGPQAEAPLPGQAPALLPALLPAMLGLALPVAGVAFGPAAGSPAEEAQPSPGTIHLPATPAAGQPAPAATPRAAPPQPAAGLLWPETAAGQGAESFSATLATAAGSPRPAAPLAAGPLPAGDDKTTAGSANTGMVPAAIAAPAPAAPPPAATGPALKLPAGAPEQWRQPLLAALGERIQTHIGSRSEQAVIRLDPPMMGSIEVVIRHEAGALQVQLSATNSEVLRQLHGIGDHLRQDLAQRQYTDVSVSIAAQPRDGDGRQRHPQATPDADEPGRALAEAEAGMTASTFALLSDRDH